MTYVRRSYGTTPDCGSFIVGGGPELSELDVLPDFTSP